MMRPSQRRRVAAGLVAVCGLVGSLGLGAQEGEPNPRAIHRTLIAKILAIDPETFALTLEAAERAGETDDLFHGDPVLRRFLRLLAVGDLVQVSFYEARVVAIAIGGGGTLPPGVRPGQSLAVRPALRDGTVTAVDVFARSITVVLASSGNERTFDVAHESLLVGVQVGDTVTLTVAHPILTDVTLLQ